MVTSGLRVVRSGDCAGVPAEVMSVRGDRRARPEYIMTVVFVLGGRVLSLEGGVFGLEGRVFLPGPEGLEFCLESGVPPGGPCFFFSVWRAAFCLETGVGPEGRVLVSP